MKICAFLPVKIKSVMNTRTNKKSTLFGVLFLLRSIPDSNPFDAYKSRLVGVCLWLLVDGIHEVQEGGLALGGALVHAGILQDLAEDPAGFF